MKNVFLFISFFVLSLRTYSQTTASDQLSDVKLTLDDTLKAKHLNDLSWNAIYAGKYDSASFYISKSLKISTGLNYKVGIGSCYNTMATIAKYQGEFNQSLNYYFVALKILESLKHKKGIAMIEGGIGLTYYNMGKLPQALEYNFKSLKISEQIKDSMSIASDFTNIAMIYMDQKNFHEALKYYEKGLAIFKTIKDTMRIGVALNTIGVSYNDQKQYDKALEYCKQALVFSNRASDIATQASIYTNLGAIYINKKQLDSALANQLRALNIWEELGDGEGMAPCLTNIGNIYDRQNKAELALKYVIKGNALAKKVGSLYYMRETESILSNIYRKQNNYKEAYDHYLKYIEARDSIYNEENTEKILRTEINYEFEKKQAAAEQEQAKKAVITEANRKRQQFIIWAIAGLFLVAIIISLLIVRQTRLRNKQREMQLEQKLLRSQMNPHFIFNSLQAIQNFILKHNEKDAVRYLGSFANIARNVLENSRLELISVRKEQNLLENYLQLQKLRFGNRFDYVISIDETIDLDETFIPPMLSQPFIENALEHGMSAIEEGGLINVNFRLNKTYLVLEIIDNGYGIDSQNISEKNHTSLATTITKERIALWNRKNKNEIIFSVAEAYPNAVRKGVKVSFSIPINEPVA